MLNKCCYIGCTYHALLCPLGYFLPLAIILTYAFSASFSLRLPISLAGAFSANFSLSLSCFSMPSPLTPLLFLSSSSSLFCDCRVFTTDKRLCLSVHASMWTKASTWSCACVPNRKRSRSLSSPPSAKQGKCTHLLCVCVCGDVS